ncbi:MAG: citrate (Si)-synthase [Ignavibacteria bacterium]|nr:citrate (Si)-synthase [Ignavibacteria bacterium]
MSMLKAKLSSQVPDLRERVRNLGKNHGTKTISQVTVEQVLGGMRGVKSLICDTSEVGLDYGLVIRGIPILKLTEKLPEDVLWLMLTGELPNEKESKDLQSELNSRMDVPEHIWNILDAFPADTHPMNMLSSMVTALGYGSKFKHEYEKGLKKDLYWEYTLEDSLDLIAKMPVIASAIYRKRFGKGDIIKPKKDLDWGANYAYMLGVEENLDEWYRLMRMYMVIHCDHESGNVSAFTSHVVGSALSDVYYSLSAGLAGLAGPLHGLANQECLKFILEVLNHFGKVPGDEELRVYAKERLDKGLVIPGYGHAVLRVTDPRFTASLEWGKKVIPNDDRFMMVEKLFRIVPDLLIEQGKAKDPWPNVDAATGALLYHYGIKEIEYYTVIFSVSRALGICSQLVLSRAMGEPITRPKSVTTDWLEKEVSK